MVTGWSAMPATAAVTALPTKSTPALPDRVGKPLWGTSSVIDEPITAASVAFGSGVWWYDGSWGKTALVSGDSDTYRLLSSDTAAGVGEIQLLSPDGTRLALPGGIVDLSSGQRTALPRPDAAEMDAAEVDPAAWSPDGRSLAVIRYAAVPQPDLSVRTTRATLDLVQPSAERYATLAELDPRQVVPGFTVAFAPDGTLLAYQTGDTIVVSDLRGSVRNRFTVPHGTRIAGKGAWTPDGRGLTLVSQRLCCAGEPYPARWRLHVVDAATGTGLAAPLLPEQSGLVALRLLGWSPAGEAVVARYHPDPGVSVVGFDVTDRLNDDGITSASRVNRADVAALPSHGSARVLVATRSDEVQSIDVADFVIASGGSRPGRPPTGLGPYTKILLTVVLSFVAVVVIVGFVLVIRLRGPGRPTRRGRI